MKVLHLSDIHYNRKGQFEWIDKAMAHAVETGIREGCSLAVISGDVFDRSIMAHDPAFAAFIGHVAWLATCMDVIVLYGTRSHDHPGCLDALLSIQTKYQVIVADGIGAEETDGYRVAWMASINKGAPEVMEEGPHAWTARQLANLGSNTQRDKPSILVTHGTVSSCVTESQYAMVSPDHEFSIENLASANCDAVMLGHIHQHQSWPNVLCADGARTTIAYAGSLARLVHGHMASVGFPIWTVEAGKPATFEFHESPSRQLLEISFPGPPDMGDLKEIADSSGPDDAVRVRFVIDEEKAASVDKESIRRMFAHACSIKIESRVIPVTRARAAGITKANTLHAKLKHWCETTGAHDGYIRTSPLLDMVLAQEPEEVTRSMIDAK